MQNLIFRAFLLLLFVITGFVQAQHIVTGTVTDSKAVPLPGASILEKGTTNGVQTDFDGNFSIDISDENAVLVVSYIGFGEKEVQVNGQSTIDIQLEEAAQGLDEVVVVGYGSAKTGRPGGGLEDNSTSISVRGVGSFGAKPDALVLIDGIPGTLNDINPDDMKTFSILKDASSAAIYRAKSANGVILITTKSGKDGKFSVNYNTYVGFNQATELPEFVNSWEYAELYNIASGSNSYSAGDIEKYRAQNDPDNFSASKLYPTTSKKIDPRSRWYITSKNFRKGMDDVWPVPESEVNVNPKLAN